MQQLKTYYIYLITNKLNSCNYIGKRCCPETKTPETDISYMGSGVKIKKDQQELGIENFSKDILAICHSNDEINILETEFIKQYRAVGKAEYNIADGGEGGYLGEEWYRRTWNACHNPEYSEKIRQALKYSEKYQSIIHSKEHSDKIKEIKRKNPHKHTEETRKKMSLMRKGRKVSDETKKKMSLARRGRKVSDETKKKISLSQKERFKNRIVTEEDIKRRKLVSQKIVEKTRELRKSEEYRKRLSEALKNSEKCQRSARDPEIRKRRSEAMKNSERKKIVMNSSEYKEKISKIIKGRKRYTDGITTVCRFTCPEGFHLGITRHKENRGNTGMKWYTNGKKNIMSFTCPEGFYLGKIHNNFK